MQLSRTPHGCALALCLTALGRDRCGNLTICRCWNGVLGLVLLIACGLDPTAFPPNMLRGKVGRSMVTVMHRG